MLQEVLTKHSITAKYQAKNRNDAVCKSGELLVRMGAAESTYVDAMIENLETNGAYIVIAPGIAMPHARPETGAKRVGFSLVTLAEPVVFGHPTNDPVKLVLGFCAIDQKKHLQALAELMTLLSDEDRMHAILKSRNTDAIYQLILEEIQHD